MNMTNGKEAFLESSPVVSIVRHFYVPAKKADLPKGICHSRNGKARSDENGNLTIIDCGVCSFSTVVVKDPGV